MNTSANLSFDAGILSRGETAPALAIAAAAAPRVAAVPRHAAPMQASLWRYTLDEQACDLGYHRAVRSIFGVIAALSVASLAYAAWITYTLMAGNHLQDAVAAITR